MNATTDKQWYVIYTRPRWEKKVADLLTKRKIQTYCPLNRVRKQWSDRRKVVTEPLFTSYVFVYATPEDHVKIKQTDGVLNFVYWLNRPAVIKQEEIDTIRKFLNEYDNVFIEKLSVNLNDRVRITNGPLMMWEGNVIEVRTNTVKIILPSLGQSLVAEIRKESLEKVRPLQEYRMKAI